MGKSDKKKAIDKLNMRSIEKRNVTVKLTRMSEMEYKHYSKSSKIIVKNFDMKISGGKMTIDGKEHRSNGRTFNLKLEERNSQISIDFDRTSLKKITPVEAKQDAQPNAGALKCVQFVRPIPKKSTNRITTLSKCVVKTLTETINDAWKMCKMDTATVTANIPISVGDLVMARMKTYSAWPARVDGFSKNGKRANVHFFGSNNSGAVEISEIVPFCQCRNVIKLLLLRKLSIFHKGIREIETLMGICSEMSLLKEIEALH